MGRSKRLILNCNCQTIQKGEKAETMRKSILLSLILVLAFTTVAFGYNEAPMLARLVEQGKPPVEERLPKEPLVVESLRMVGMVELGGERPWPHRCTVRGPLGL